MFSALVVMAQSAEVRQVRSFEFAAVCSDTEGFNVMNPPVTHQVRSSDLLYHTDTMRAY
jgi:hypothetical protein